MLITAGASCFEVNFLQLSLPELLASLLTVNSEGFRLVTDTFDSSPHYLLKIVRIHAAW